MSEQLCRSCRFWDPLSIEPGSPGLCRRYAPKPFLDVVADGDPTSYEALWPQTEALEWCGEWQPAPLTQETR